MRVPVARNRKYLETVRFPAADRYRGDIGYRAIIAYDLRDNCKMSDIHSVFTRICVIAVIFFEIQNCVTL